MHKKQALARIFDAVILGHQIYVGLENSKNPEAVARGQHRYWHLHIMDLKRMDLKRGFPDSIMRWRTSPNYRYMVEDVPSGFLQPGEACELIEKHWKDRLVGREKP